MADDWHLQTVTIQRDVICRTVLEALPEWFGIPESIDAYVTAAMHQPMIAAYDKKVAIGFVSLCQHFPESFEVHSMGVLKSYHRAGIGRALIDRAGAWVTAQNGRYLSVKTLGEDWQDENYARTRAFYRGVGFIPVEEFQTLWGDIPCLLMMKSVGP